MPHDHDTGPGPPFLEPASPTAPAESSSRPWSGTLTPDPFNAFSGSLPPLGFDGEPCAPPPPWAGLPVATDGVEAEVGVEGADDEVRGNVGTVGKLVVSVGKGTDDDELGPGSGRVVVGNGIDVVGKSKAPDVGTIASPTIEIIATSAVRPRKYIVGNPPGSTPKLADEPTSCLVHRA